MATEHRTNPAARLGFQPGQVVQEIGYGGDVDHDLRKGIEAIIGQELEGSDEVGCDVVLLWFRDDDGDLADALAEAIGLLGDGVIIWLMTPKQGRDGYLETDAISEAAVTAGLSPTEPVPLVKDWNGARMVAPKR
ncbi:DUF3052 domain-containing protein [Streptomyces sp. NEAU-H22]|uniref:DUF3052 domain-containing protein n=1 Tax=unclassified Streptomyces TaxID=2593676 RepID=UPI00224D6B67|nr:MULTISPECIES: DUF3052 domain-containing protein [unclassified Streptomyces]MCX3287487.1 DUF3052 domain-containing protein [Streptomyces sp. NEAU-H22]WMD09794.1 DUF3052 domain-containing protein [Streptomyces sp. FXY-T5]